MDELENMEDLEHQDTDQAAQLRADARAGLAATPKWLPPRWFYDARGSELFEQITRLPEYYPTRTERQLLAAHVPQIAEVTRAETLVELGSGSSEKTRLLLDALRQAGTLRLFVPLDVSDSALAEASEAIAIDYPGLQVRGVVGDFTRHLKLLPGEGARLVAFLGGTIGNLLPPDRTRFLVELRDSLEAGEWLLLGAGLVTDPQVLVPAYDDAAGVTGEFNRNMLHVLNRELGADFDVAAFTHRAVWDADREWIEMRLEAAREMTVHLPALEMSVHFAEGEQMRTEVSAKFRPQGLAGELSAAGFAVRHCWTDAANRFGLWLAQATR